MVVLLKILTYKNITAKGLSTKNWRPFASLNFFVCFMWRTGEVSKKTAAPAAPRPSRRPRCVTPVAPHPSRRKISSKKTNKNKLQQQSDQAKTRTQKQLGSVQRSTEPRWALSWRKRVLEKSIFAQIWPQIRDTPGAQNRARREALRAISGRFCVVYLRTKLFKK